MFQFLLQALGGIIDIVTSVHRVSSATNSEMQPANSNPSRGLPSLAPEIILEIFKHAPKSVIGTGRTADMFALSVTQVCRSWRGLALSEPQLWASISWQPTGDDAVERTQRFAPLWMLHLQRSKQALLDVDISSSISPTHVRVDTFGELFEATLANQHRLRSFTVLCDMEHLSPERVYLLASAPMLERLDVCVNPISNAAQAQEAGGSITVDLSGCSAVRSLNLEGNTSMHHDTGRLGFLKEAFLVHNPTLHGQGMSCNRLLTFLRSSPSLERLTVVVRVGEIIPAVLPPVSLPRLRTLHVHLLSGDTEAPDALFGSLDLPSLENLDLTINVFDTINREWRHATSLRNLRSLKLQYTNNQGPAGNFEFSTLLSFTPALKSLHICAQWLSSMTMDQLTLRDWAFNLCPELESITFDSDMYRRNTKTHFVDPGALVNLIASRWRPGSEEDTVGAPLRGLRRIRLRLPELDDIKDMEPVRSYMEEGLVVEMF